MIYIQHTCRKRDKYVDGSYSRRADLYHYSPFTLWSLQKTNQVISIFYNEYLSNKIERIMIKVV